MQTCRLKSLAVGALFAVGAFNASLATDALSSSASAEEAGVQAPIVLAQFFNRGEPQGGGETAELLLRVDRLENQIRNLNGQLEQMQFQVRRTEEAMKKFQQDVDFRFQELSGGKGARPAPAAPAPGRRSDLGPDTSADVAEALPGPATAPMRDPGAMASASAPSTVPGGATPRGAGRRDVFDPAANPDAPGAPRPLGSPASASTPLPPVAARGGYPAGPLGVEDDADAPLDLSPDARRRTASGSLAPLGALPGSATPPARQPLTAPGAQVAPNTVTAALPPTTPRDEFDVALFALNQGQFDSAESTFKGFLQRYPKDRLTGEAVYYLGESYFKRGRHRDAAEQYLKISTDYPKTTHAPDALVRLGLSLEKLGAKEQACAFYSEVGRKYPAATTVKASAQREAKRAQC